ncbi:MAG: methionyl-tRNA formyltransferase [Clostridium perfringens]|uniref:methionyl-tRNA formyltransferase n=1 Tax=Clostridium perfringens TaxID=1502 RepID=UPI0018A88D39|nr:methionyl-tRNA formyltransferase [Clostridium perfringens]EHK2364115.1 methionyl-tRNA formyltransferase [Clostridium perfringens]EHR1327547.1 methionyl-tRNA formyltransferase [Clostridium perfringens]EHR1330680.1 methionyl-tRNA formyltransferase [Clostridium perfringens]EHR1424157.1 methionyl-tRNA formyltransferase [Clostridium perfringens]EIF6164145.1 methionyl-tRNA formyltransferase [Clostridium perfringens]
MKIVFMGTPDFAVPSLKSLINEFGVEAIFTQPDRPKGRGKKLGMSPVKEVALEHNIPVYQPLRLKNEPETIEELKNMEPDFIIVVAFGQILPKEVLDIPKYGCINLHASLLPKFRGAAPLNWSIIKGEKVTGNTTMLMDVGLDTGDMLLKDEVEITDNMTAGELHDILMERGGELLVRTIKGILNNEITPEKQNEEETCYASMLNKEIAKIDWSLSAQDIHNLVRGLNPWPVALTSYDDITMKVHQTRVEKGDSNKEPGTIISVDKTGIKVSTGKDILVIEKLQFPNSKQLFVEQFINGNSVEIGKVLK